METSPQPGGRLAQWLPITGWLPRYHRTWLRPDLIAGVALAGLLVPEGMGYAGLAGVPPQAGLYAALAGLFIYALFGSSRQVAVSSTSSTAVMAAAVAGPLSGGDPGRYLALVAALVLTVGLIFIAAWVARLGFVSDFIARPVVTGFVFGLALIIGVRQAPKLLGIPGVEGNFFQMAWDVLSELGRVNLPTLTIGAAALVTLFLMSRFVPRVPGALLVLVAGIAVVALLQLKDAGVAVVGLVPSGLPRPSLPHIYWGDMVTIVPSAAGIALVAFAEGLGSARTFATRYRYDIFPGQELKATGLANVGSGLLGGIVVTGGLSGTSANDTDGAKSEVSTLAASAFILLTLLLLTPLFRDLPEAVLGAIVIHAVRHMVNVREIRRFARVRLDSLGMSVPALLGVLIFGVLPGLMLAVGLSFAILARELSQPRVARLGKMKKTGAWVSADRHPEAVRFPGIEIYRIQGVLFFASANVVRNTVRKSVAAAGAHPPVVVIDLEMLFDIDATSAIMLDDLRRDLKKSGAEIVFTNVHHPVEKILKREGLYDRIGPQGFFPSVDEAVEQLSRR